MVKVMSPQTPSEEMDGMREAESFFAARPSFSKEMVQMFGEQVYTRRGSSPRGDGFCRMAYILAQQRKSSIKSLELECPECGAPETDITVGELQADRSQEAYCRNCGLTAQVEEFKK